MCLSLIFGKPKKNALQIYFFVTIWFLHLVLLIWCVLVKILILEVNESGKESIIFKVLFLFLHMTTRLNSSTYGLFLPLSKKEKNSHCHLK